MLFDRAFYSPDGYSDCRFGEGRVHGINRNGVVRIRRVTTDVHGYPEPSSVPRGLDLFLGHERGDACREVNTVDKNVNIEYLLEGPALRGLIQVPFDNVISTQARSSHIRPNNMDALIKPNFLEKVNGATSAASEGTDNKGFDVSFFPSELRFDIGYHGLFIRIWL